MASKVPPSSPMWPPSSPTPDWLCCTRRPGRLSDTEGLVRPRDWQRPLGEDRDLNAVGQNHGAAPVVAALAADARKVASEPTPTNVNPSSMQAAACSGLRARMPAEIPASRVASTTRDAAERNLGASS